MQQVAVITPPRLLFTHTHDGGYRRARRQRWNFTMPGAVIIDDDDQGTATGDRW